jgi:hypothetical protein
MLAAWHGLDAHLACVLLVGKVKAEGFLQKQYALANQFDPFSAVAAWVRIESRVQEAAQNARAAEQVFNDTADLPLSGQPVRIEPEMLDA